MKKFQKLKTRHYLNQLVKNQKRAEALYHFTGIDLCQPQKEIHVFQGIEKLAKAIDQPLSFITRSDSAYPLEQDFYYRGLRFFQLDK